MESIAPLVKQGLIARPRYLQLERSGAGLEGQAADAMANIAKARQAIAEQMQQMAQLDNDRMTEVARDLRDTQAKLLEVIPRLMNAKAVLGRMEIRSPYAGQVVGLSVFSVGGVIGRGDKILDVVPDRDSLIIEAQINVDDISDVHPDMRADVHLTAYKARITPVVRGKLTQVSADRLTENRTGTFYYTALVQVDQNELADLPNVKLYPGMPANVMFPTIERTAFDYLVGPLPSHSTGRSGNHSGIKFLDCRDARRSKARGRISECPAVMSFNHATAVRNNRSFAIFAWAVQLALSKAAATELCDNRVTSFWQPSGLLQR